MYITQERELKEFCSRLQGARRIAVDAEFIRERTYFPILALVQVASDDICAAIDPIEIESLDPIYEIFHDPKVEKVFHAAKQDLEIFYQNSGKPVQNIFDTQIAASLVGFGAQVSLLKLVEATAGASLDKSETYTNWLHRPLSDKQITYALDDVRYLLPSQDYLMERLRQKGRDTWLLEDFKKLEDPGEYMPPKAEDQYQRIKGSRSLKPRALAVLRELAAWRVREAEQKNRFLNAIVHEESLMVVAQKAPRSLKALETVRGLSSKQVQKIGPAILEAVQKGLAVPKSDCPVPPPMENNGNSKEMEDLLWIFTQHRAKKLKMTPSFLAPRQELGRLAKLHRNGSLDQHPLLNSWKKDLIGNDLLSILDGDVTIGVDTRRGSLKLIKRNGSK